MSILSIKTMNPVGKGGAYWKTKVNLKQDCVGLLFIDVYGVPPEHQHDTLKQFLRLDPHANLNGVVDRYGDGREFNHVSSDCAFDTYYPTEDELRCYYKDLLGGLTIAKLYRKVFADFPALEELFNAKGSLNTKYDLPRYVSYPGVRLETKVGTAVVSRMGGICATDRTVTILDGTSFVLRFVGLPLDVNNDRLVSSVSDSNQLVTDIARDWGKSVIELSYMFPTVGGPVTAPGLGHRYVLVDDGGREYHDLRLFSTVEGSTVKFWIVADGLGLYGPIKESRGLWRLYARK